MIDLISLWVGRIVLVALAIYIIWHLILVFAFAIRDTIILIRNVIESKAFGCYYWRIILIPLAFCGEVWAQINARIGGYKSIRSRNYIEPW